MKWRKCKTPFKHIRKYDPAHNIEVYNENQGKENILNHTP